MANAKQCDRCGKLYLPHKGVQLRKGGNGYTYLSICGDWGIVKSYDLCEECMTSLIKWINEAENDRPMRLEQSLTNLFKKVNGDHYHLKH